MHLRRLPMSLVRPRHHPVAALCMIVHGLVFAMTAHAQSVALSFDDGPNMADATRMTPEARNTAILTQLAGAHLKSILFVTRPDADPKRNELLHAWGAQGHAIANHTATHVNFDDVSLGEFEQDLMACETALRGFPGFTRRFRFPYLKEGVTADKRDGFRAFLDARSYKSGAVSIDASDWYYDQRLRQRLQKDPNANLRPYRDAYLRHLDDRSRYYDGLSRRVLGRSVAHVLLLHHNLINALFLSDAIGMFRDKGWTLVDSEAAFADPVYAMRPNILPAGESILWALAREKGYSGLRFPGEDEAYEKPIVDRLHL